MSTRGSSAGEHDAITVTRASRPCLVRDGSLSKRPTSRKAVITTRSSRSSSVRRTATMTTTDSRHKRGRQRETCVVQTPQICDWCRQCFGTPNDLKRHLNEVHHSPRDSSITFHGDFSKLAYRPLQRKSMTRSRDYSPSSASADTDELLERDEEAAEIRAELIRNYQERIEFSRRLQEVQLNIRRVQAEMDGIRNQQRERQLQIGRRKYWS